MISNKHPQWLLAMADMESEDPLFVRSHVSAEFLEATCELSNGGCADWRNAADPFYLTPAQQSSLTAGSMSLTGHRPTVKHTATREPCPACGQRPWWGELDEYHEDDENLFPPIDEQTGFIR